MLALRDGVTSINEGKLFGKLQFCGKTGERVDLDETGNPVGIKKKTYALLSHGLKEIISVGIPGGKEIDFPVDTEVRLVNVVLDTIAEATYNGVDNTWYIVADDIVAAGGAQSASPAADNKPKEK